MLNAFQQAWSSQDIESITAFFAEDLQFEDIPIGLHATNKDELREILDKTFCSVPDFKMEILEHYAGEGFVVTKWRQTGTMTANEYGLNLDQFPYATLTTSIIRLNAQGRITSVSDNWDTSPFYQ